MRTVSVTAGLPHRVFGLIEILPEKATQVHYIEKDLKRDFDYRYGLAWIEDESKNWE